MGMFNGSLDLDKTSQTTDTPLAEPGHADPRPAGMSLKVVFLKSSLSTTFVHSALNTTNDYTY